MEHQQHLANLTELKSILSKNTRFLAFSGMSGIIAGAVALIGEFIAYSYIMKNQKTIYLEKFLSTDHLLVLGSIAALIVLISITVGYVLTKRNIDKEGGIKNFKLIKNTLWNICIPIIFGGLICLGALLKGDFVLIPSFMLIFYGLALFSGSKYSFDDLKFVGLAFMILGLFAYMFPIYSAIAWGLGFGVLHIIYGLRIHLRQKQ
jgi:hypothetical protein